MAQETTDKKSTRAGIPMSPESLAEYEKTWADMDECVAWCYQLPCKLDKKKSENILKVEVKYE